VPELPDVEGFCRLLRSHAVGQSITSLEVRDPGVIRGLSSREFARKLKGRRFFNPVRRGKWLLAPTDGPTLFLHFGMTGSLVWDDSRAELQRFDRAAISVGGGRLLFRDQRKLGGLWLANDESSVSDIIGEQGPDALGLTGRRLEERLEKRRGALKSALMDQKVLAGIGNTLSDEVLWRARINPERRFSQLNPEERHHLDLGLQRVLRASIKKGAIPRLGTWLTSQRSRPEPTCPRCQQRLNITRVGGRTSYWCPACQPQLAKRR
jgi:formamidopyrimidine-DNA glycosylase